MLELQPPACNSRPGPAQETVVGRGRASKRSSSAASKSCVAAHDGPRHRRPGSTEGRACAPEAVPAHFQRRVGVALAHRGARALHAAAQAVIHQPRACCARCSSGKATDHSAAGGMEPGQAVRRCVRSDTAASRSIRSAVEHAPEIGHSGRQQRTCGQATAEGARALLPQRVGQLLAGAAELRPREPARSSHCFRGQLH